MRRSSWGWRLALLCLTMGAVPASVDAERYWIQLPRAASVQEEAAELGLPRPNGRALRRRALRGDPDRMARYGRGPFAADVEALRARGVRIRRVSRWLSAVSCEMDDAMAARLAAELGPGRVRRVRDLRRSPLPAAGPPLPQALEKTATVLDYGPSRFQIEILQAERLHAMGLSGLGVRAMIMDTGFFTDLPAFAALDVFAERDFIFDDDETANEAPDSTNQHAHGTGVLGLFAGYDPGELIGAAYASELVLAKTEWRAAETRSEEDDFVAALEWGEALGIDLVSASLGYICFDDSSCYAPEDFDGDSAPTTIAMDAIAAFGVLPITAAGNRGTLGPSSLLTPADADSALTVGSVGADSAVSVFSGRGPTHDGRIKPDVVGLGEATVWARHRGGYGSVSGTSTATPLVAAVAALLVEAHPEWNAMQFRDALRTTADQNMAPDNDRGYGLVRGYDALFAFGPPEFPMPFELLAPAEGESLMAQTAVSFRWRRARDYQDPDGLRYELQFSSTPDFTLPFETHASLADSLLQQSWLPPGEIHWRVVARDPEGHERASRTRRLFLSEPVGGELSEIDWVRIRGPQPNPSRGNMVVDLRLRQAARADAAIYDLRGRRVRRLLAGRQLQAGLHLLRWDGRDGRGRRVASGSYRLSIELDGADGRQSDFRRGLLLSR